MATVYYAFDPRMDRDVAVKVLLRELLTAPQIRERFSREAKVIAALDHPAIVSVYDYGEDEGDPFIVMRYMGGGSLADRIKNSGALPIDEAAVILHRVAAGLDRAHEKGMIHRDLKPGNILFDQYGSAFLSDFGIVKVVQDATNMTGTGAFFGTPHYMSPEQVSGEQELDGRSDIYALGVILYEMLTAKTPFTADTPLALAFKHVFEEVPPILEAAPDLPAELAPIMNKVLEKNRDERYATAGEFATAVLEIADVSVDDLVKSTGQLRREDLDKRKEEIEKKADIEKAKQEAAAIPIASKTVVSESGAERKTSTVASPGAAPAEPTSATLASRPVPIWGIAVGVIGLILLIGAAVLLNNNQQQAAANLTEPTVTKEIKPTNTAKPKPTATKAPTKTPAPTVDATGTAAAVAAAEASKEHWILFAAGLGTSSDLYLMKSDGRPDGSDRVALTTDKGNNRQPRYSPDGTLILFKSDDPITRRKFIAVMDADGKNVKKLTDGKTNDYAASWSPDGTQIVFISERLNGVPEIFIMNADGSDPYQVTFTPTSEFGPQWSPDGKSILYFSNETGGKEIYTIEPNGQNQQRLTDNLVPDYDPVWSPDGTQIAYVSESGGQADIWVMDADGKNPTRLTTDPSADTQPAWSADGTRIVFTSRRYDSQDLILMDADGKNQLPLTRTPGDESDAVWKP